ncbi:MAG TPA: DMT family transporter [Acidimicrobiia bacterium]|nr:DMT family transporter [Acidimicrobiia bacterium]
MSRSEGSLPVTASGSQPHAFTPLDWTLLATAAVIWGSSFVFIAEGLEAFGPGLVTFLRIAFGAAALSVVPAARAPVPRAHRTRLLLLAVTWMAVPFLCFSLAEQWIASSLAGMLNGAMPILTAVVASALLRRLPGPRQVAGVVIGCAGVVAVSVPALDHGDSGSWAGVGLVLVAVSCYAIAANVAVPLQQTYGALPVLWRTQLFALGLTAPLGIAGVAGSSFAWSSALAVVALGVFGTGLAFVAATTLFGRVGATRGSVAVFFVPVVAIVAGAVFRDEEVALLSIIGALLVLSGAALASRAEAPTPAPVD